MPYGCRLCYVVYSLCHVLRQGYLHYIGSPPLLNGLQALAVHDGLLYSSANDRTVRLWDVQADTRPERRSLGTPALSTAPSEASARLRAVSL